MAAESTLKPKLGFIGQGWIGRNYADYYEDMGFDIVRYSNELSFSQNQGLIKTCDIVFVSVPTPTTPKGFDYSTVEEVLALVAPGKIAILKSTLLPGTTLKLQESYPSIFIFHVPEFLSEKTARFDIEHPDCNVIGSALQTKDYKKAAQKILGILPQAPSIICTAEEAEFIKYTHNIHGFMEILYSNLLFDLSAKLGIDWNVVRDFMSYDRFMTDRYATPLHASGHSEIKGRGAGGHCFIKDFAAFKGYYENIINDPKWTEVLKALEEKNIELLTSTKKDEDILKEVYGDNKLIK